MFRILGMVIAIFCTATVLTGVLALGIVWSQGNLTRKSAADVASVLKGEPIAVDEDAIKKENDLPSYDDVVSSRTSMILSLSTRETELAIIQQAITDQLNAIRSESEQLEQYRGTFQAELKKEEEKIVSESAEFSRATLLKMDPESAVEKLSKLDISDAVLLIKGMGEKDAAKILDQFRERITGKDPVERVEKAEEIFKAIYQGNPLIGPVDEASQAMKDLDTGAGIRR